LVRKCLFTSAVQRDGIAEIERDCGDLETGRAAIVQDPAVRLKPLVECAQGGEHGCWAMLDQWESKWNGVFEGFDDTPENRKIIEEALRRVA